MVLYRYQVRCCALLLEPDLQKTVHSSHAECCFPDEGRGTMGKKNKNKQEEQPVKEEDTSGVDDSREDDVAAPQPPPPAPSMPPPPSDGGSDQASKPDESIDEDSAAGLRSGLVVAGTTHTRHIASVPYCEGVSPNADRTLWQWIG